MSFRVTGLNPAQFADLQALSDEALAVRGAKRVRVESKPAAPCRISLDDAEIGESVILLNYDHQPAETPYRQQGPIFVRETRERFDSVDVVPPALARRTLSLRGFGTDHMMAVAVLSEGSDAKVAIENMLADPAVSYIHAHYATRGCFAALIERA